MREDDRLEADIRDVTTVFEIDYTNVVKVRNRQDILAQHGTSFIHAFHLQGNDRSPEARLFERVALGEMSSTTRTSTGMAVLSTGD